MSLPRSLTLVAVLSLAGCGGEIIVPTAETRPILAAERTALAAGPRLVEVLGAPPDQSAAEAVAAAIRVPGERNDRPFTVTRPASGGQRVVVEFGMQAGGQRACTAPSGSDATSTLQMAVTYCNEARALSTVSVRSATIMGPSNPDFARMMDRVMLALLEVERPRRPYD